MKRITDSQHFQTNALVSVQKELGSLHEDLVHTARSVSSSRRSTEEDAAANRDEEEQETTHRRDEQMDRDERIRRTRMEERREREKREREERERIERELEMERARKEKEDRERRAEERRREEARVAAEIRRKEELRRKRDAEKRAQTKSILGSLFNADAGSTEDDLFGGSGLVSKGKSLFDDDEEEEDVVTESIRGLDHTNVEKAKTPIGSNDSSQVPASSESIGDDDIFSDSTPATQESLFDE